MNQPTLKPTLDLVETAQALQVHPKTVLDLIQSGALPAAKIGRKYVLMTTHVLRYVEDRILHQTRERMATKAHQPK